MICFCFPIKDDKPGGVQSMIVNLGEWLFKNNIAFKSIDYKNGYIDKSLSTKGVKYLLHDLNDVAPKDIKLDKSDTLIVLGQYEVIWDIIRYQNCKIFFWEVMPRSYNAIFNVRKSFKEKYFDNWLIPKFFVRKFIEQLITKKAVTIINGPCRDEYKKVISSINNISLLPIPINSDVQGNMYKPNTGSKQSLTITYIGRGSMWKVIPLRNVIESLVALNIFEDITVSIVTEDRKEYQKILEERFGQTHISFLYLNGLDGEALKNFLLRDTQILFAMGTSALEGGRLGIPTVLVDAWESEYPIDYKYLWLSETENFSLGERLFTKQDYTKGHSMKEIVASLNDKNAISTVSDNCYNYCKCYYVERVAPQFLELANQSTCTIKELKWMFRYVDIKQKIYSVSKLKQAL